MRRLLIAVLLTSPTAAFATDPLAAKASAILDTHCHRCHGKDGAIEGGFNYILDFAKLADRKKVVAGNAAGFTEIPLHMYFLVAPLGFMATAIPISPASMPASRSASASSSAAACSTRMAGRCRIR